MDLKLQHFLYPSGDVGTLHRFSQMVQDFAMPHRVMSVLEIPPPGTVQVEVKLPWWWILESWRETWRARLERTAQAIAPAGVRVLVKITKRGWPWR
jgi:hypothetical protein